MKIALVSNPYRDHGLRAAQKAKEILEGCGVTCCICLPFEPAEGSYPALPDSLKFQPIQTALPEYDAAVCFGGDGTILHAARHAAVHGVPLLGVNLGSVGFMAELEEHELAQLTRLADGNFRTEKRMMLTARLLRGDRVIYEKLALNDAVVSKSNVARVVELELLADGIPVYQLAGDGIIVSTPTGSTAYSLSSGGPVVDPSLDSLVATPVCAHQLTARPVIIAPDRTVTVRLMKRSRKKTAYLCVDGGRVVHVTGTDRVEISRAQCAAELIVLGNNSFYQRLNQKLGGNAL